MTKSFSPKLIRRASSHLSSVAIVDEKGKYTYQTLLDASTQIASDLLGNKTDLEEERIGFLLPSSFDYVKVIFGIWQAGGIAVPLCVSHPLAEYRYVIQDAGIKRVVVDDFFRKKLEPLALECLIELITIEDLNASTSKKLPPIDSSRSALIIYTSGTTGKPKGAVSTHANIEAQIENLTTAWHWTSSDYILNVLPLHHVHGLVNVLCSALWNGASCRMVPRFDATAVWQFFKEEPFTVFMAVPTIYHKLIQDWERHGVDEKKERQWACKKMRLMISGSAALPISVLEKWEKISGHFLLERYGMTEIGMALSNAYMTERYAGCVGKPLPSVITQVVDESGAVSKEGELWVKGPSVFKGYWQKEEATKAAFQDGWFMTGDRVLVNEAGIYKILGRNSVDIIKTGGYKVSALEIEEVIRRFDFVEACAVVGLPDEAYGQIVAAALVLKTNTSFDKEAMLKEMKLQLAKYKVPTQWKVIDELPRNAMGKVMKPRVMKLF